jgi:hypothetical protein
MNKNGVIAVLIFWFLIAIVFFAKPLGYEVVLEKIAEITIIALLFFLASAIVYILFTNGPNDNSDGFDGY